MNEHTQAQVGMMMAFKADSAPTLADIPGEVVQVWPIFGSGDYFVTLKYAAPVTFRKEVVTYIDALASDVYPLPR